MEAPSALRALRNDHQARPGEQERLPGDVTSKPRLKDKEQGEGKGRKVFGGRDDICRGLEAGESLFLETTSEGSWNEKEEWLDKRHTRQMMSLTCVLRNTEGQQQMESSN